MPKWKLLLAPAECCTSPHKRIDCFLRTKSEETVLNPNPLGHVHFFLALLGQESFSKPCCCLPTPAHSALNSWAATDIVPPETTSHRHVASKEFVQPSKVALCGFVLKVPADTSLSGNYKLHPGRLFGLMKNLIDHGHHLKTPWLQQPRQ